MLKYETVTLNGKQYRVSLKGCQAIGDLSEGNKIILLNKIEKIAGSRNNWGTASINGRPVTIYVEEIQQCV